MDEFKNSRFAHRHLPPPSLRQESSRNIKCPSANSLDITCPCEQQNYVTKLVPKKGIHLIFVPAKLMRAWLAEITRLVDFSDRKVMQPRCFYAHASNTYRDVNAEPVSEKNRALLQCTANWSPRSGQERFLLLVSPQSYCTALKNILQGPYLHNFTPAHIYVDEFHGTKSD